MLGPYEAIKKIDDKLSIAGAYIKEKIPEGAIPKTFTAPGAVADYAMLGKLACDFLAGSPLGYLAPLKAIDTSFDLSHNVLYNKLKDIRARGAISSIDALLNTSAKYTRQLNFYGGITMIAKPICEFAINGSAESPMIDVAQGTALIASAASRYIKTGDDEGLKKYREEKEAKSLEGKVSLSYQN